MGDWLDFGGSALGAIGSIGGGFMGQGQSMDGFSKKGSGQQLVFETASAQQRGINEANKLLAMAGKAKIHPLALVGNTGPSSPVISGQAGDNSSIGYGVTDALKNIGQDITNANYRNQTAMQRDLTNLKLAVDIDREKAHKELLSEQLRQMKNPPAPSPTPEVIRKPAEVIKGTQGAQHGSNPSEAYFSRRDPKTGRVIYFRGKGEKFTEATEEDFAENLAYNIHKGIVILSGSFTPPYNPPTNEPLMPGYVWKWNTRYPYQGWYQEKTRKKHWEDSFRKGREYYEKGGKYFPPPKKYRWKGGD